MQHAQKLKDFLSTPKKVVLSSHRNPDGDAMGSTLAMYHYLTLKGHEVFMMVPSEYPDFLEWMPAIDKCMVWDNDPEKCGAIIEQAQLIYALDYNALDRVDKMGEKIKEQAVPKVLIDHHLFPDPFAEFMLSDTSASSTCELVYVYMEIMGDLSLMNMDIGEALYTGIVTDTGSFKYATNPRLFKIVSDLVSFGVNDTKVQDFIYNSLKEKNLRLLGHCLNNRMEILDNHNAGIIYLTKEDYETFDIQRGDTEGIVNYLLRLKKVNIAAFIHEQPKITKLSLRSKGDISVQEIAKKYFRGGGHKNAAGGASFMGLDATIRKFKQALTEMV